MKCIWNCILFTFFLLYFSNGDDLLTKAEDRDYNYTLQLKANETLKQLGFDPDAYFECSEENMDLGADKIHFQFCRFFPFTLTVNDETVFIGDLNMDTEMMDRIHLEVEVDKGGSVLDFKIFCDVMESALKEYISLCSSVVKKLIRLSDGKIEDHSSLKKEIDLIPTSTEGINSEDKIYSIKYYRKFEKLQKNIYGREVCLHLSSGTSFTYPVFLDPEVSDDDSYSIYAEVIINDKFEILSVKRDFWDDINNLSRNEQLILKLIKIAERYNSKNNMKLPNNMKISIGNEREHWWVLFDGIKSIMIDKKTLKCVN